MSDFVKQVGEAVDYVAERIDDVVDGAGELIKGDSGQKIAGGALVGAAAAVVLPVSILGGAVLGAGYALFRHLNKNDGETTEPQKPE